MGMVMCDGVNKLLGSVNLLFKYQWTKMSDSEVFNKASVAVSDNLHYKDNNYVLNMMIHSDQGDFPLYLVSNFWYFST